MLFELRCGRGNCLGREKASMSDNDGFTRKLWVPTLHKKLEAFSYSGIKCPIYEALLWAHPLFFLPCPA